MKKKLTELGSFSLKIFIETIIFFSRTLSFLSSLTSDPLFSIIVSIYSLILLYFPRIFFNLVFSPILISTGILLLTLLRLGSIQINEKENNFSEPKEIYSPENSLKCFICENDTETETETKNELGSDTKPFFFNSYIGWNVGSPLEVIYEEFEGEEDDDWNEKEEIREVGIDDLQSLSLCYPESDSSSSSGEDFPAIEGWDSRENMWLMWDEEEGEGLIEISLDDKRDSVFQVEEENLIEIEISPGVVTGG